MDESREPLTFEQPEPQIQLPVPPPPRGEEPWEGDTRPPMPAEPRELPSTSPQQLSSDVAGDSNLERLAATIAAGFAEVLGEFRDKLSLDRFKEDQITRLHEEVQTFRNDLVLRIVRQVLQGLIRLHDDMGKVLASLRERPSEELTPEQLFQQIEGFRDDVELLLGQHGVERFEAAVEEFDPRRQTALRTVPAGDPAQVGRIAERLRPGFEQGETLLQKERVAVFAASSRTNEKAKEEMVP
jgi:molecular chaperone GrpE